jgi:hypothetical protein
LFNKPLRRKDRGLLGVSGIHTQTHRQEGHQISLRLFFYKKESRLKRKRQPMKGKRKDRNTEDMKMDGEEELKEMKEE